MIDPTELLACIYFSNSDGIYLPSVKGDLREICREAAERTVFPSDLEHLIRNLEANIKAANGGKCSNFRSQHPSKGNTSNLEAKINSRIDHLELKVEGRKNGYKGRRRNWKVI